MRKAKGLLFAALLLGSAGFYQPVEYDNAKSRYLLLSSIVDQGCLDIDSHHIYTIDKAYARGHYYSIKPIGLPYLAVPAYWALRWALPIERLPDDTLLADPAAKYLVRLAAVGVPFALLGVLLFAFLEELGLPARGALWACLAWGFGTIALNHAAVFSGHDTAAFFLFASFYLLRRLRASGRGAGLAFLAGVCAGGAVLCDYLCAVYAVILAAYALTARASWKEKGAFAAGAALCAAVLASYDLACFGKPFVTGYSLLAFAPFRQYTSEGLFGIGWPRPGAAWGLLGSVSRGVFFISPVLMFSLAGLVFLGRRRALRAEFLVLAGIPAAALLLYSGYHAWHGGWGFGSRYLVDALPFLAAPMALLADGGPLFQALFWGSAAQTGLAQLGWPWAPPEIRNPLVEFIVPLLGDGVGSRHPWAGLACLAAAAALSALALRALPRARRRRLPPLWRAAMAAWLVWVAAGLALVRTPDSGLVERSRDTARGDWDRAARQEALVR